MTTALAIERKAAALEKKEAEAIAYIRAHEPEEGYTVAYSGGKDSEVVLDLTRRSGVRWTAHYCNTTIDPPEVLKHIRKRHPEVKILRSERSFWQWIMWAPKGKPKGLPTRGGHGKGGRWCCDVLKERPARKEGEHHIVGIRAEESSERAKRPRTDSHQKYHYWLYKPIFRWKLADVWNYIRKYNLPYLSLYENRGCMRVGCVVCPFVTHNKLGLLRSQTLFPRFWKLLLNYCRKMYNTFHDRGIGWIDCFNNGDEIYEWWQSGISIKRWKEKKEKEKNLALFRVQNKNGAAGQD